MAGWVQVEGGTQVPGHQGQEVVAVTGGPVRKKRPGRAQLLAIAGAGTGSTESFLERWKVGNGGKLEVGMHMS